jgi:PIN domain nuclease of toxin-antitoxin system
MRLLLDTNALIWLLSGDERLRQDVRDAIADEGNTIFVSAVSMFEMAVKVRIGKLDIDLASAVATIDESDIERLEIEDKHCLAMAAIAPVPGHRDPFDLMLVAQAMTEGLTVISSDHMLGHYPVTVMACAGP